MSNKPNYLLAIARIIGLSLVTIFCISSYAVCTLIVRNPKKLRQARRRWMQRWGKGVCRVNGYNVTLIGKLPHQGVILAANHVSYGDIMALLSVLPVSFVSKAEIEHWPLVGRGAKITETIFVSRRRHDKNISDTNTQIATRLEQKDNIVIFFESTTSNGTEVLPFRPSFMQAAIDAGAAVVPVAIKWSSDNPNVDVTDDLAYWGDHDMSSHLFRHLGKNGKNVTIKIGEPLPISDCRKDLTTLAHQAVTTMFHDESPATA